MFSIADIASDYTEYEVEQIVSEYRIIILWLLLYHYLFNLIEFARVYVSSFAV
jgi:hypothetical protein